MNFTFRTITLGCKVNRVESDSFEAALTAAGLDHDVSLESSDIVVVNTCTVTSEADSKVRKSVRRAVRESPHATVFVTGCAASIDPDALSALDPRVRVVVDKSTVVPAILESLGMEAAAFDVSAHPPAGGSRTRVPVKIQDGCGNACTYCIIHVARGPERSESTTAVLATIENAVTAGVREVVLTGINLGRYSTDDAADLAALLVLIEATGIDRVRLSSIEPPDITESLIATIADTPSFMPHLHIPLQSGSDKVLAEMGRRYTTAEFAGIVDRLRAEIPGIALTTDVIVGFPGETDDDFAATHDFVERMGFSKVHVFRYSQRDGTPAAGRADQVDPRLKAERAAALIELSSRLREKAIDGRTTGTYSVLVENIEDGTATGTSQDYFRVAFAAGPDVRTGEVVDVTRPASIS